MRTPAALQGVRLVSQDGAMYLFPQTDGNLVLYRRVTSFVKAVIMVLEQFFTSMPCSCGAALPWSQVWLLRGLSHLCVRNICSKPQPFTLVMQPVRALMHVLPNAPLHCWHACPPCALRHFACSCRTATWCFSTGSGSTRPTPPMWSTCRGRPARARRPACYRCPRCRGRVLHH